MTWVSRRVLVHRLQILPLVGAIAFGSILSACSKNASGAVGTSGQNDRFVALDTSAPPVVTIENRTAQPLVDVNVTIKSGILTFTDRVSRLEANEKRPIRHSDFTSRDGTSFNLRVARPREVVVSAKGLDGKTFESTLPWQSGGRFSGGDRIGFAAMTLLELCEYIQNSQIGTTIRESNSYWMLNGTHVLGIAISAGAIFWFDLRAMGLNMRDMRISEVYRQINAWMVGGFVLMFVTGAFLFWARAADSYMNVYFRIKLAGLVLAGCNAMYFNLKTKRGIAGWDTIGMPPLNVRMAGLASIVLWGLVIASGRLMAYTF